VRQLRRVTDEFFIPLDGVHKAKRPYWYFDDGRRLRRVDAAVDAFCDHSECRPLPAYGFPTGPHTISDWPAHLRDRADLRAALRREADRLHDEYSAPVWLVGSALNDSNKWPRDWDIRITLRPVEIAQLYSGLRRGSFVDLLYDYHEQSRLLSGRLGLNVDFQVYPANYLFRFTGKPRFRLDTRSTWPQNGDSPNFTLV
jgi:hypothetical protein